MKYIQYRLNNNKLYIPGTNEFRDLLITLACWKNKYGYHSGCYRAAQKLMSETMDYLDRSKRVQILAHSMGGGIGQIYAIMLKEMGYSVNLILHGAYRTCPARKMLSLPGKAVVYRADPVPVLFRKRFFYPVTPEYTDRKKRTLWRLIKQAFKGGKGDHMGYYR